MYKPVLRWAGGKQKLLKYLIPYLPKSAEIYIEPFIGGGSVYFYLKSTGFANSYWINDKDRDLIKFYTACQDNDQVMFQSLDKWLKKTLDEKKDFFYLIKSLSKSLGVLGPAGFYYLNRCSFSGSTKKGGFSRSAAESRFTQSSIDRLREMPEALKGTKVTCSDYKEVIKTADKSTFLFLDPPYVGITGLYTEDIIHQELADLLVDTKAKFMLTYNNCKEVKRLYRGFNLMEIEVPYSMSKNKVGKELIITNYDP